MRVIRTRCLKCGSVFEPSQKRISYCITCFADEAYLKPVMSQADQDMAQASGAASDRGESAPEAPPSA